MPSRKINNKTIFVSKAKKVKKIKSMHKKTLTGKSNSDKLVTKIKIKFNLVYSIQN